MSLFALLVVVSGLGQLPDESDPLAPLRAIDAQFEADRGGVALAHEDSAELGPYALLVRARDLRRIGQAAQISSLLVTLLKEAEPLVVANAHLELAEAALVLGHPAEAQAHQRNVLATHPLPAELRARASEGLGRSSQALGEQSAAHAAFEQAAALDPDGEAAERALAALGMMQTPEPKETSGVGRRS